jgi:protein CLEC16A
VESGAPEHDSGLFKGWFRPKKKFSLDNLRYLYTQLVRNHVVMESNKNQIVEILRSIAELMIWGDQHNENFFDFFCEKSILSFFLKILMQKCDVKVKIQVLQTLSILIANTSSEQSVFYLLSNNYINDVIVHRFDFSNEELLAYYISFLKTLSLKLNENSIQFFFNERANDFPLYTEAIMFFAHL